MPEWSKSNSFTFKGKKNGTGNLGSLTSYKIICELFNPKLNQSYKRAEKKSTEKPSPECL